MGYSATIKDGKVVDNTASSISDSIATKKSNDSLDKEAFLQLLVAQMQYQDPLEPTSNTEYISQLATFSELEAMNNLNDSMSLYRASQLIGERVIIKTTSASTGETYLVQGVVDYVGYESGQAYVYIDENPYSLNDVNTVVDSDYWDKYENNNSGTTKAEDVTKLLAAIKELPDEITLENEEAVASARKTYDALSADYKQQVDDESLIKLIKAEAAIAKLKAQNSEGA